MKSLYGTFFILTNLNMYYVEAFQTRCYSCLFVHEHSSSLFYSLFNKRW